MSESPLTSISMRFLAAAGVVVLGLAACAEPSNDNVSLKGPSTTVEDATTSTTKPAVAKEVGRFTGDTDSDTANFTAVDSWELHWKAAPGSYGSHLMSVNWTEPGTKFPEGSVQIDTAEGSSLVREGGTFYLHVATYGAGSWEVWVVDVPG